MKSFGTGPPPWARLSCPGCGRDTVLTKTKRPKIPRHTVALGSDAVCPWSERARPRPLTLAELPGPEREEIEAWRSSQRAKASTKRPPPRRRRPPSTCPSGKVTFWTEEAADRAATKLTRASLRRSRPAGRSWARPYVCPSCRRWHLTSLEATA